MHRHPHPLAPGPPTPSLNDAEAAAGADIGFDDLVDFESGSRRHDPATVIRLFGQYRSPANRFSLRRRSGHRGVGRPVRPEVLTGHGEQGCRMDGVLTPSETGPLAVRHAPPDVDTGS
jgi:hypothetical protein